jgi:hypothetical protein
LLPWVAAFPIDIILPCLFTENQGVIAGFFHNIYNFFYCKVVLVQFCTYAAIFDGFGSAGAKMAALQGPPNQI